MLDLSIGAARRVALAAQGFADPRPSGRIDRRHLRRVMNRLELIQLDSVPVIIRTQYLPFFSRLGPYRTDLLDKVAYHDDEWFEAWTHEASLVPISLEPFLRWHKARSAAGGTWAHLNRLAAEDPGYIAEVLAQVDERGPLAAGDLDDPRPRSGQWWGSRSVGAIALDWLFRIGEVGIRRTPGFEKRFDRLDRIVPAEILSVATPTEQDAHRELLRRAGRALGVATAGDLADYWRLKMADTTPRLSELVESGDLQPVSVEGWPKVAYLDPVASTRRRPRPSTLVSPFDPIVWCRDRARRLFDFEYRLEIYTPAAKRRYGYYVLPFLHDGRIAARVDLKTDRAAGVLRVLGAFAEPGVAPADLRDPLLAGLHELAELVEVDGLEIGDRGDAISALR